VLIVADLGVSYANAAGLAWEVSNPFRLYRHDKSFNLHQSAFNAVVARHPTPCPAASSSGSSAA
jgi:hypothetical protein